MKWRVHRRRADVCSKFNSGYSCAQHGKTGLQELSWINLTDIGFILSNERRSVKISSHIVLFSWPLCNRCPFKKHFPLVKGD
jgi:hypothetical protein